MVLALVVDHELGHVLAEVVAHHLQREIRLGVDERGRLGALGVPARDVPQLLEQAHVALELVEGRALGRRARDQAAVLVRLHLLEQVAQAIALGALELLGHADTVAARCEHHEAAGQRDVHRETRALRSHRILGDLDEDVLAGLDQFLDALRAAVAVVQLGQDDLGDVEEPVLGEPDVDEGRLHAGQDGVDPSLVDVADDRAAASPFDVRLRELAAFDDRDPHFLRVGAGQHALDVGHVILRIPLRRTRRTARAARDASSCEDARPRRSGSLPPVRAAHARGVPRQRARRGGSSSRPHNSCPRSSAPPAEASGRSGSRRCGRRARS